MNTFNRFLLAATVLGASSMACAEDSNFAGLTYGKTLNKISKSSQLDSNLGNPDASGAIGSSDNTWGVRVGRLNDAHRYYATYENVSGTHNGIKLRQENLLGSYDVFLPLTPTTQLFGGGTAGLVKLTQDSPGYSRDTDIGYAIGGQAGVIQQVAQNVSVELGYRYLRSNASTEMAKSGQGKQGSLDLTSTSQTYLSANYQF